MIPWFELRVIHLGPITIYVWGVFVALAILLGVVLAARFVRRRGLSADLIIDAAFWMVVGGLTGARLLHVFAYEPEYFLASPLEIFKVWHGGLSSFGGMIGGVLALLLFLRLRRMRLATFAPYLYAIFFALPFAWGFGRIGCFLTKMHPGIHNSVMGRVWIWDSLKRFCFLRWAEFFCSCDV
ncbi:MAG: diacylglyceryl transferase [Candidatus Magasanikbacteria bacterium]|nr:diacylglyceryl transferase [Candidatus Magasanikbacteria bacterium]